MRRAARGAGLLLAVAVACLTSPSGQPQPLVRTEDAVVALFSLQTDLEVDNKLLKRLELRLEENRRGREETRRQVERLYNELDELFTRFRSATHGPPGRGGEPAEGAEREGDPVERLENEIELKQSEVRSAERAEAGVSEEGHKLRDEIRLLKERMRLLSAQIDQLQARLPQARDSVTGLWEVTMLPQGIKGIFALFQSGTIVTGQYSLDGPFQGSLEGTLIDRRLLLHRIDSRLGRSMDYSAALSSDGQAFRGTWENYDLSGGQARTGAWSGRRRPQRRGEQIDEAPPEGPAE